MFQIHVKNMGHIALAVHKPPSGKTINPHFIKVTLSVAFYSLLSVTQDSKHNHSRCVNKE